MCVDHHRDRCGGVRCTFALRAGQRPRRCGDPYLDELDSYDHQSGTDDLIRYPRSDWPAHCGGDGIRTGSAYCSQR